MPVFAPGVPRYEIRPPTDDDGQPSGSLLRDAQRVLTLIEDERHLLAHELLQSVQQRLAEHRPAPTTPRRRFRPHSHNKQQQANSEALQVQQTKAFLEQHALVLSKLEVRLERCLGTTAAPSHIRCSNIATSFDKPKPI